MTTTRSRVAEALSDKRYRYTNEATLHRGLAAALDQEGVAYEHEVKVIGGRIDFIVERCGVEVKIKGSTAALDEQIERYAVNDHLDEFLIVTTAPIHRRALMHTANGKPVDVLVIGGLSL